MKHVDIRGNPAHRMILTGRRHLNLRVVLRITIMIRIILNRINGRHRLGKTAPRPLLNRNVKTGLRRHVTAINVTHHHRVDLGLCHGKNNV